MEQDRFRKRPLLAALAVTVALFAAACGGGSESGGGGENDSGGTSGSDTPTVGGEVSYGLEAETSGGYCLAEIPASDDAETVLRYYRALFEAALEQARPSTES